MLPRWSSVLNNLKLFLAKLELLLRVRIKRKSNRGRKPKRSLRSYLRLIITKEYKKASLRSAEQDFSKLVCKRRVDHSVIHYWEKKFDKGLVESITAKIGKEIEKELGYDFTFMDSTKFTTWGKNDVEFHATVRITDSCLYPVGLFFDRTKTPSIAVRGCIVKGNKNLLADAWYDDNKSFGIMFDSGYDPIVKPNKDRWKGHNRKKARKLYFNPIGRQKYKQRPRGESIFGALTNQFGDRLKTLRYDTSSIRIGSRVIAYLVRIYMRIDGCIIIFLVNF